MKKSKYLISKIVFLILVIISGLSVYGYFSIWIPHAKLMNESWWKNTSQEEKLTLAHKILSTPIGNHHGALLIILKVGNKNSIPYLLKYLKRQGDATSNEFIICTRGHCIDALKKITGKDVGLNYSDLKLIGKGFR